MDGKLIMMVRWFREYSMTVDSDGKMKTDFDYTDISNDVIEYEEHWKEKYLV